MLKKIWENPRLFKGLTWGITGLIVLGLVGATLLTVFPGSASVPRVPTSPAPAATVIVAALPPEVTASASADAITRQVTLKTTLSGNTSYDTIDYTVQSGDSVFSIAKKNNIKPETVLFANYDILQDQPDSLRVGQVLKIPPVDGVYYQWQQGDTLQAVADKFSANVDDILNFPGNKFDLTNPDIKPGDFVMVPGGSRAFVTWIIPTVARGASGTANVSGSTSCSGGPVGTISNWRTIITCPATTTPRPTWASTSLPGRALTSMLPARAWSPWRSRMAAGTTVTAITS